MQKNDIDRKVWLQLLFLSLFGICLLPTATAQLNFGRNVDEVFSVSVTNYEYPYLVTDLNIEDTGENLIVTGKLHIEANASLGSLEDVKIGYVSEDIASAELSIKSKSDETIFDSSVVTDKEVGLIDLIDLALLDEAKPISEYIFPQKEEIDGSEFTYVLPRAEGEIHFGENSTILGITTWACGYKVENLISSDYVSSAVSPESFGFSDVYGGIHTVWMQDGVEFSLNDICNDYMYLGVYTPTTTNRLNGYLAADSVVYSSPTKFFFNETSTKGSSRKSDWLYYGYPFIISKITTSVESLLTWPSINNGNEMSSVCGDDMTGSFACNIKNAETGRRYVLLSRSGEDTYGFIAMFDRNFVNATHGWAFSFTDSSYDYINIGSEDGSSYYLPSGTGYALYGYMTYTTAHQDSYYGNQTFDDFMVYPNPTISTDDSVILNNFKVIHVTDSDANGYTTVNVIPNSLLNSTYWYFDFPNYLMQKVEIKVSGDTCTYTYNTFNYNYTLDNPTCPFSAIVMRGAGIGFDNTITSVAIPNYKFTSNSSQTIEVHQYYIPIPEAVGSSMICQDNSTLIRRLVTNETINGINTVTLSDEIVKCQYGCGEWLFGDDCLPSDFMIVMYAVPVVMVAGFIVFRFPRFVKKKKKKGY